MFIVHLNIDPNETEVWPKRAVFDLHREPHNANTEVVHTGGRYGGDVNVSVNGCVILVNYTFFVSEFAFSSLVYCCTSSPLVVLFTCLLDLTISDLHSTVTLAITVHSFHIQERHI